MGETYTQLQAEERGTLMALRHQGQSQRAIARALHRSPSTICRELRRNRHYSCEVGYDAVKASHRARRLRHKPRVTRKLHRDGPLWPVVHRHLQLGWSPEQIAGRLGGVSHETIYTAIYAMPRGQLRHALTSLLRQHHRKRRPRRQGADRRGRMHDLPSIHVRPPAANERLVPGHWEGDLLIGTGNHSAVGTLVDRHSLFVMLARVQNNSALAALEGFSAAFASIPPEQRQTLTYDQGKEMALHRELARRTGLMIYFADPHSPWQRGINENTNGLLRQYLPKHADLSVYCQRDLDQIAWLLNTRPRKSLGFRTPAEVFFSYCTQTKGH